MKRITKPGGEFLSCDYMRPGQHLTDCEEVESVDIEIDDSDFKDALIKAFKAGVDAILTMGNEQ